jgi:hypothetical protein
MVFAAQSVTRDACDAFARVGVQKVYFYGFWRGSLGKSVTCVTCVTAVTLQVPKIVVRFRLGVCRVSISARS